MLGWRIGIQGYSGGGRPIGIVRDESEWSESKAGGGGNSLGNILIMGIRKFSETIFTIEKRAHSSLFCFFLIKNLAEISKFFFVVFLSYSERTLRYVFGEEMKKQELKVL